MQQNIPIRFISPRSEGLLRAINPERVQALVNSIKEIGLQTPISLRVIPATPDTPGSHNGNIYQVAAGNHRLEAYKLLERTEIPAILLELSDVDRRLWEIDENLVRGELTKLERAEHLNKRKALYIMKHPETEVVTKRGGPGRGNKTSAKCADVSSTPCFVEDTAQKTGMSERSIEQSVQRAQAIAEPVKQAIVDMPEIADSGVELDALASVAREQQKAAVEAVKAGKAPNVRAAVADITPSKKRPNLKSAAEMLCRGVAALEKRYQKTTGRHLSALRAEWAGGAVKLQIKHAKVNSPSTSKPSSKNPEAVAGSVRNRKSASSQPHDPACSK